MRVTLLTQQVLGDEDVVAVRQQARHLADRLGFDSRDQTWVATAASEVARHMLVHAGGGQAELQADLDPHSPALLLCLTGRHEADGWPPSEGDAEAGPYGGLPAVQRLVDAYQVQRLTRGRVALLLSKRLPLGSSMPDHEGLGSIAEELSGDGLRDPAAEVQRQNQELLSALGELRARQVELERVNQELEDTNRGVLALYAELDEKAEGLKRLSDEKSRFLSHMSHEFRTPLSSIQALSQLLLDRSDGELTLEQERQVGYIRKAAVGLNDIVNDLLDIAKIEAGMVPVRPCRFTVPDMFSALRGMLRPLRSSPTVELVFEDASGLPPLFTDEAKVSQILRNLISNALKYTEQGEVRVSAQIAANETVTFRVADTGVGIAEEHQGAIFQEFLQVEGAARRPVKGTGLGLPLSRRLAVLLGGELGVRSALGEGSLFWTTIPVVYSPRAAAEAERGRVLVIDKDRSSRDALRALLEGRHLTVVEARTSAEGLRRAREERPQAIFLDLELAGGSGLEVLDRLEADPQLREVPVIVNTSRVLDGAERADLEHRVVAVLPKQTGQADDSTRAAERLLAAILGSPKAGLMEGSGAKQP